MKLRKKILASSLAFAIGLGATPVFAVLTIIEKTTDKPPIPQQQVVEEGARIRAENERLSKEIAQLRADLNRVEAELTSTKNGEQACSAKLANISKTLDKIERLMEEVGTALVRVPFGFRNSKFEPTPEIGEALVAAGKKASRIKVIGHADNTGSGGANRAIALARALAAKKYLTANGVPKNKVIVFSRGSDEPVGDNSTEEGRAENRRADIVFDR